MGPAWVCYVRVSIVVSISACHADDPGSIPGRGSTVLLVVLGQQVALLLGFRDVGGAYGRLVWLKSDLLTGPGKRPYP